MSLPVEELVNQTNRDLRHLRNHKDSSNKVDERNNSASQKSILYIQEFWPHLCNVIRSDPERLGLSLVLNDSREDIILKADDLKREAIKLGITDISKFKDSILTDASYIYDKKNRDNLELKIIGTS